MTEEFEASGLETPGRQEVKPGPRSTLWTGRGARGLAFAAIALIGGIVAVATLHSGDDAAPRYVAVVDDGASPTATPDPLMAELIRCRSLLPQASDPTCERAWDENRRRFFGEPRAIGVSSEATPAYAAVPIATAPNATPPALPAPVETGTAGER